MTLGNTIALVGLTITVIGGLVGVIWKMHSNRVRAVEERMREDRETAHARSEQLFNKIDKLNDSMAALGTEIMGLRGDFGERFVSKEDCERCKERHMEAFHA